MKLSDGWLTYEAQRTGKTVEEVRQIMRERGLKADKSKRGFASMSKKNPKKFQQALDKSAKTRQNEKKDSQSA